MTKTDKDMLNDAFKALRQAGLIARQNFKCCSSCALSALDEPVKRTGKSVVFYHRQDAYAFGRNSRHYNDGNLFSTLYLRFGAPGENAEADKVVGQLLHDTLVAHGFGDRVKWDGDPRKCVEVEARR